MEKNSELTEIKNRSTAIRGEISLLKKKHEENVKTFADTKSKIIEKDKEHDEIIWDIRKKKREKTDLEQKIQEKDQTIKTKEERIQDLKRKNNDLEKFK